MNDFLFEQTPWETYLFSQQNGSCVSASNLFAMLEEADEETIDDAFAIMAEKSLSLDLRSLPRAASVGPSALRLAEEIAFVQNGWNTRILDETDPLRLYLEDLASIPAYGDENVLAADVSAGDEAAASELMNLGLSRVQELVSSYVGFNVLLMDLIQEASIGLWQAIHSYSSGNYTKYRDRMICNALDKTVFLQAKNTGIAQKMRDAMQDYKSVDEKLLIELGRNPSLEEIAANMHVTREEAEIVQKMMEDALLIQQAEKISSPAPEEPDDELAVEDTAYFQMRQRIEELLSALSPEDAKLLTLRFGLEKGLPLSPEEAGRIMGLTTSEVISRESAALSKLRN